MENKLLIFINHTWTSPAMDAFMAAMSSLNLWLLPFLLLALLMAAFGRFRERAFLVVLILGILVSDTLVANSLKHLVGRPRPNEVIADVRIVSLDLHHLPARLLALVRPAPGSRKSARQPWVRVTMSRPDPDNVRGRSFPSSHTMNNFCAAVLLSIFFRRCGWLYFIPATLVAYSRIYVGSHWPSDVAISIIMGIGVALLLLPLLELLWRNFGARALPRVFARHPSLWEHSLQPAPALP